MPPAQALGAAAADADANAGTGNVGDPAAPCHEPELSSSGGPSSQSSPGPSSQSSGTPSSQSSAGSSAQSSGTSSSQSSAGSSAQSSSASSSQSSSGSSSQSSSSATSSSSNTSSSSGRSSSSSPSSSRSSSSSSSRSSSSRGSSSSSSSPKHQLWVRLGLTPGDAANEPGSLRLQGTVGGYDRTLAIASNFQPNPDHNTVDVIFRDVPTNANYSLTYIAANGTETTVVHNAPYNSLNDNSLPKQSSATPSSGA